MSRQIQQLIEEKKQVTEQLAKEREAQKTWKTREAAFGKQIDDLVSEKRNLNSKLGQLERELKEAQHGRGEIQKKFDNNYARFEDAMSKMEKLESELKEQEATLLKRHNEINKLLKDNRFLKDEADGVRKRFGSIQDINKKFDLAKLKEEKVADLVAELDHTMVSSLSN